MYHFEWNGESSEILPDHLLLVAQWFATIRSWVRFSPGATLLKFKKYINSVFNEKIDCIMNDSYSSCAAENANDFI